MSCHQDIVTNTSGLVGCFAEGDTPAHAICRAVVLAHIPKVEDQ